jgi:lysophospholipase L1-like esterase
VPPRAAFIGDSYTQGGGADPDTARWSTLVAAALGWEELNFGRGGTGFVTSNSYLGCGLEYCPTYVETVPEVAGAAPDIVVVAGGQNDFDAFATGADSVRTAIWETYIGLRAALPGAAIVAVGPSTPWEVDDIALAVDAEVRAAAGAVGAEYVSMLDPNVIDPAFLLPDGHVNNDGHRVFAERVVAALTRDVSDGTERRRGSNQTGVVRAIPGIRNRSAKSQIAPATTRRIPTPSPMDAQPPHHTARKTIPDQARRR